MPVNTPRTEYSSAFSQWQRARDCAAGTDAVKGRGISYLPQLDSHKTGMGRYDDYLKRAMFFNATAQTVRGLAGSIFQKTPSINVPTLIEQDVEDVTLTNTPAELFALEATREILITGRYGVLVDMAPEAQQRTLPFPGTEDEQREATQRPYWVGYAAEDVISWRMDRIDGDIALTRVVLCEHEEMESEKDPWVLDHFEQYRVLQLIEGVYTQQIWRRGENHEWSMVQEITPTRRGQKLDFIPFVFLGPTSLSCHVERPPLIDLVDLNLSHYRTMADLEHGRHFTALPTPWVAGFVGSGSGPLMMGSGVAWELDKDGKAGMLEFTGQGLTALVIAEQDKRKMMATLGARLLEDAPRISETATAVSMRHSGQQATLRTIAQVVEQAFTFVLKWHAWWVGTEATPADVKAAFELNKEFTNVRMSSQDLTALLAAIQAEKISWKTFYEALARGDITRAGISADEELEEIKRDAQEYRTERERDIAAGLVPDPTRLAQPPEEDEDEEEEEDDEEEDARTA